MSIFGNWKIVLEEKCRKWNLLGNDLDYRKNNYKKVIVTFLYLFCKVFRNFL
uniref:Uncharacterized protein n=1 Tax=viral metagenome TaxID=1070528 RepID=A0A6C0E6S6_9ZZZZ